MLFERLIRDDYEQVVFCQDNETGLKAIIAIHDTTLAPALGSIRFWPYDSEEEVLTDVLRLAKGMTYKNAATGSNLGGGKAIIIGDPKKIKTDALACKFDEYLERLNGRYIAAEDMNTTTHDMDVIRTQTVHVAGNSEEGSVGNIAFYLCNYLHKAGGVINIEDELHGYDRERATLKVAKMFDSLANIFAFAKEHDIPTNLAANKMLENRIQLVKQQKKNTKYNKR